jgi:site-specific DNA-methyltransferase (adenine-specific)
MRYTIEIRETLSRQVHVDAPDIVAARDLVEDQYKCEKLVLDSADFVSVDFIVDNSKVYPYYKSDNGDFTIIKGDCVDTLSKFNFGFDMVFADPPYFLSGGGISYQSGQIVCVDKGNWDKPTTTENMDEFNLRWLSACRDHMKDNATIWISGTYHNIFRVQQQLLKLGFKILNVITWAKTNPPPNISCRFFTYSSEFIIWARKLPKVPHYYDYELMKELNGNKQMTDVWYLPAIGKWEKSCGKHPTQKPLSVLSRIIQASTKPGDWILDPFSGSGTTGIAANLLGRNYLGLEIEEEFLSMSKSRRSELDNVIIRQDYIDRLVKAKIISPIKTDNLVLEPSENYYSIPWL